MEREEIEQLSGFELAAAIVEIQGWKKWSWERGDNEGRRMDNYIEVLGMCRCCGKQDDTVQFRVDPFSCEVDDNCDPCWMCDACVEKRRDDI